MFGLESENADPTGVEKKDGLDPKTKWGQLNVVNGTLKAVAGLILAIMAVVGYFEIGKPRNPSSPPPMPGPPQATKQKEAAKLPEVASPTPAAPTPHPTPPVATSASTSPPVNTTLSEVAPRPSLLRVLCQNFSIPKAAESATTLDAQICAIAACTGEYAGSSPALALLVDWRNLTQGLERNSCRHLDRIALADNRTVGRVLDAVYDTQLPDAGAERAVCRAIKEAALAMIHNRQATLRPSSEKANSCPPATLSSEVQSFADRYELKLPD